MNRLVELTEKDWDYDMDVNNRGFPRHCCGCEKNDEL